MQLLHSIFFSAKGTTKICAECIGDNLNMEVKSYDWLRHPCREPLEIPREDVLLFSMPVYGGFIPKMCGEMARHLKGSHTPAILAAVYGNRHYDNALLQMKDILTDQGFWVIAAGAFLAEHSIFTTVATGRPNENDKAAMAEFAKRCSRILAETDIEQRHEIKVPGTPGYDADSFAGAALKPDGDDTCISCGSCAKICPKGAVDSENPCRTDREKCISCGACISICPVGARNYHGSAYMEAKAQFEKKCSEYKNPKTYYIDAAGK